MQYLWGGDTPFNSAWPNFLIAQNSFVKLAGVGATAAPEEEACVFAPESETYNLAEVNEAPALIVIPEALLLVHA